MTVYIIYSSRFREVRGIYKTLKDAKADLPNPKNRVKNRVVIKKIDFKSKITKEWLDGGADVVWSYETTSD